MGHSQTTQRARQLMEDKLQALGSTARHDLQRRLDKLSPADWESMGHIYAEFGEQLTWPEDHRGKLASAEARLSGEHLVRGEDGILTVEDRGPCTMAKRLRALRSLRESGVAFARSDNGSYPLLVEPYVDLEEQARWVRSMITRAAKPLSRAVSLSAPNGDAF